MIATGYPYNQGKNTEVIDLTNPNIKCNQLEDVVPERWRCVGMVSKLCNK